MSEIPSLGFISVRLIASQYDLLKDVCLDAGIKPMGEDKYHCTVCYDVKNEDWREYAPLVSLRTFEGKVIGIERMGEPKNGLINALALVLESPELVKEHQTLLKLGHTHTYDDFIPHCSLAYDLTEEDVQALIFSAQRLIGKTLYFDKESIGVIK